MARIVSSAARASDERLWRHRAPQRADGLVGGLCRGAAAGYDVSIWPVRPRRWPRRVLDAAARFGDSRRRGRAVWSRSHSRGAGSTPSADARSTGSGVRRAGVRRAAADPAGFARSEGGAARWSGVLGAADRAERAIDARLVTGGPGRRALRRLVTLAPQLLALRQPPSLPPRAAAAARGRRHFPIVMLGVQRHDPHWWRARR